MPDITGVERPSEQCGVCSSLAENEKADVAPDRRSLEERRWTAFTKVEEGIGITSSGVLYLALIDIEIRQMYLQALDM